MRTVAFGSSCVVFAGLWGVATYGLAGRSDAAKSALASPILITSFHETYSSATPADWATTADHVADVTVTDEDKGARAGVGVERIVAIRVDKVRWSRSGALPLPGAFEMPALGWVDTHKGLAELAVPNASRIEPGHRYLMALIHLEPRCNADDGLVLAGGWSVIGSGGTVPFDQGDLGSGEVSGSSTSPLRAEPGTILSAALDAPGPETIVDLVKRARAGQRPEQPGVREGC